MSLVFLSCSNVVSSPDQVQGRSLNETSSNVVSSPDRVQGGSLNETSSNTERITAGFSSVQTWRIPQEQCES